MGNLANFTWQICGFRRLLQPSHQKTRVVPSCVEITIVHVLLANPVQNQKTKHEGEVEKLLFGKAAPKSLLLRFVTSRLGPTLLRDSSVPWKNMGAKTSHITQCQRSFQGQLCTLPI